MENIFCGRNEGYYAGFQTQISQLFRFQTQNKGNLQNTGQTPTNQTKTYLL